MQSPEAADASRLRAVLETVGLVVAPTTLLTGILFYFGYRRSLALWRRFGIEQSVLGLSTQDYLLGAIDAAWVPLTALVVTGIVALRLHSALLQSVQRGEHGRLLKGLGLTLEIIGTLGVGAGLLGLASTKPDLLILIPLAGGIGMGGIAYGIYLRERVRKRHSPSPGAPQGPAWVARGSNLLVVAFLLLNMFWATGEWAAAIGRGRASEIEEDPEKLPEVTLYTTNDLHIEISSVQRADLGGDNGVYRYRYEGLRFLALSNGNYFLIPSDWASKNPFTLLVHNADTMRIEFSP